MKKIFLQELPVWQFENLGCEPGVHHFVSGRIGKESGKVFTLSYSSSPDKAEVRSNRTLLADAMDIEPGRLFFPSQVHKTRIVNVTSRTTTADLQETDALVTNEPGVCVAVMSADCVPILLYDKRNVVVAAVHSGWRGTVAKILQKTLIHMQKYFGTEASDLVAGIGPSVSQLSYEVGEEVIREVHDSFGKESGLMLHHLENKAKLDLWAANKMQLINFGVSPSAIETSDLCTVLNNDEFFSARKGDAGRFAAGIIIRTKP